MAPIYESDVPEKRWNDSEWNQYEFWEKVEHRFRRNKRLWIASTVLVFLGLSSVPVMIDQRPRWGAVAGSRILAEELNRLKLQASVEHQAFRIRFVKNDSLAYVVERLQTCRDLAASVVREGSILSQLPSVLKSVEKGYTLLTKETGEELGIPGLVTEYCYDPLTGSEPVARGQSQVGFGIAPVQDGVGEQKTGRVDRLAVLLISGVSAELSFD